jgi:MinD superfamily P-loop ATPase
VDAPPGTSCPVVAALRGCDFVLLVTEPTPFGLHDLTLAVDMTRALGLPFGVVLNRANSGDGRVVEYCREGRIPLLMEFPEDRRVAEAYARGEVIVEALPEYRPAFVALWTALAKAQETGREKARGG